MKDKLFDELIQSLGEAVEHAEGKRKLKTSRFPLPPKVVSRRDIVGLRKRMQWSQMYLAKGLNVSVKTVQAWEQGLRKPEGATLRLLEIASKDPNILVKA